MLSTIDGLAGERTDLKRYIMAFERYNSHLGLLPDDFKNKFILDIGAGRETLFGEALMHLNHPVDIVSIDDDDHLTGPLVLNPADSLDHATQPLGPKRLGHIRLSNTKIENLQLKGRAGDKREPEFDLIVSENSFPYTLVSEDSAVQNNEMMHKKMTDGLRSIVNHLAVNARFVAYPIFGFSHGGLLRDSNKLTILFGPERTPLNFGGWAEMLDERLKTIVTNEGDKRFIVSFEDVTGDFFSPDGKKVPAQRLIIKRLA